MEGNAYQKVDVSAFQQPKNKGQCNGDSYFTTETEDYFVCVVADGLGSGKAAHSASSKAIKTVEAHHNQDVQTLMALCNNALLNTRGAVITIFKFHFKGRRLEYCGIGNVRLVMGTPSGALTHPLPKSGYLPGKQMKFLVKQYEYEKDSMFIIHSDGVVLSSTDKKFVMRTRNPKIAACYLRQKCITASDDMTCIVGKVT